MKQTRSCASRIGALLLTLVMLVGMLPAAAFAAEAPKYKFGTAQTELTPGRYDLPVGMMKSNQPTEPSMAASAVKGGQLEVMDNGDAFVTVRLGSVSMMGIIGWANQWKIYQKYDLKSELVPAEVVGKDAEGHETAIRFKLPYTDRDGVYAKLHVDTPIMQMDPDAWLKMDFAQAAAIKTGSAGVAFGGKNAYDVTAEVTVGAGQTITNVTLTNSAEASGHGSSVEYATRAMAMADKFKGLSAADAAPIQALDAVSGATITSNACKDAVLKALGLWQPPKPADFGFGKADTRLQPGEYKVPVMLMNAGNHADASVAKDVFVPTAALNVAEDGKATLTVNMGAVHMGPISDMAYEVKVFQADNCDAATALVDAAVVESTKKPADMTNPGIEVPTKVSFTIPDNSWDGVYLQFKVDAMGGATPSGWLRIDYAQAAVPGAAQVKTGSAKVDQFGKYTLDAKVSITDGVISGVDVSARDFISDTHKPTNEQKIAKVTEALKHTWNGIAPTQENAGEIFYKIMKPENHDEVIDTVSGATYSAKAVRDAVMDALKLEYQDEVINVPETVEPGVYEVEIGYYSDVVWHSLVENPKTVATLTVNKDKTMTLDFETKSGTEKEPLYILAFNGVYENNDRAGKLTLEGTKAVMGLSSNDYADENFAKGTQVVNHLTFPLLGGLSKVYNTSCRMYVPAMKALNGNQSGIEFENGTFNGDVFAKIYWDTMQKVGEVPTEPDKPAAPALAEGSYLVPVTDLVSAAPLPPVQQAFSKAFGDTVRLDVAADGTMTATITLQHMEVNMGGTYHCNILTVEGASYPEMKTEKVSPTFGKPDVTQDIRCPASAVVAMPASNEKGGYEFTVTVDFMNSFLGGGLDKAKPTGVTLFLDFAKAQKIEEPKIADGNYYVNSYLWNATQDQVSMGDRALENNRRVLVTVKDGKAALVQAATNPVQMGPFKSAVTEMKVNGTPVTVQATGKLTTQEGNTYDYLKNFSFVLPADSQPAELKGVTYVPVSFVVPDTPMGNNAIDARLKLDWASAEKTTDTKLEANGDTEADNKPVELVDKATGIKLNSNTLVVPAVAQLFVSKVTSGAGYDAAAQAMDEVKNWELYRIVTLMKGEESAPQGQVQLSIPCGAKGLEIYRINEDGTRMKVNGQVENGFYVFKTSKLGSFAIIGQVGPEKIHFNDVPESYWGHDFIYRAVEKNIFAGYGNGSFGPDDVMTRGMFVTVLGKLAGVDVSKAEQSRFTDVDPEAFYAPYVAWAEKAGITAGVGEGKFAPNDTVTREQMAIFLVHYCDYAKVELKNGMDTVFKDEADISDYAQDYVAQAVRGQLLSGYDNGCFGPQDYATRAQTATVLVKLVDNYGL